jgi:hypothetical protein
MHARDQVARLCMHTANGQIAGCARRCVVVEKNGFGRVNYGRCAGFCGERTCTGGKCLHASTCWEHYAHATGGGSREPIAGTHGKEGNVCLAMVGMPEPERVEAYKQSICWSGQAWACREGPVITVKLAARGACVSTDVMGASGSLAHAWRGPKARPWLWKVRGE